MRIQYKVLAIIFLVSLIQIPVEAQFMNRLKRAAERGVNRAIEKKIESEVEKAARRQLDKIYTDAYGVDPSDSANTERINQIMQSIYTDIEVADSYSFNGHSKIEFTGTDEKGKPITPFTLTSFFSTNPNITGMEYAGDDSKDAEEGPSTLIFDFDKNVAITLIVNEGQQMRFAYAYDAMMLSAPVATDMSVEGSSSAASEFVSDSVRFEKTGNTKSIHGFDCEEYLIETDESTTLYWVTKAPINSSASFWSQNNPFISGRMKSANPLVGGELPDGNIMEAHVTSRKDKSRFDLQVVEVNPDQNRTFIMADYPSIAVAK